MEGAPLTISVVIPVYNEANTFQELLRRVRDVPIQKEIIVIDDGSTDGTRELLNNLPADIKVLFHDRNRGKGAALRTGFAVATGDILIVQDADLEYDPQDYLKLLEPIRQGQADVVYGVRFTPPKRAPYFWSFLINTALTRLSNLFTNLGLSDIETCYKVFPRAALPQLRLRENRFGFDPEFTSKIAALPYRIVEVPVSYSRRSYKEGKKIGVRDGFRAIWCVLRYPPRRSARRARRARGT